MDDGGKVDFVPRDDVVSEVSESANAKGCWRMEDSARDFRVGKADLIFNL